MKNLSPVGKIAKLFGAEGEVVVNLYDSFPMGEFNHEEPLFAIIDSLTVPLFIDSFTRRGNSGAVVRFADIDNEKRASELLSTVLYMADNEEDEEEDDGQFYMEDFVGFTALIDGEEGLKGEVTDFINNDDNPLFALEIEGSEILVPAVDEMVASFDTERRKITFVLPEGLLEIYLNQE